MNVNALSFQDLIGGTYGIDVSETNKEPMEIVTEALDLVSEIYELATNSLVYETVKKLKKKASGKKKVRVKKTRTTSKAARSIKKNNRHAKIRREDSPLNGGNEVDPSTLPDSEPVVVYTPVNDTGVEITDENVDFDFENFGVIMEDSSLGDEYMIIYEDEEVEKTEEKKQEQDKGLWAAIKKFFRKIYDFFANLLKKAKNAMKEDQALFDEAMKNGLTTALKSSNKKLQLLPYKKSPTLAIKEVIESVSALSKGIDASISQEGDTQSKLAALTKNVKIFARSGKNANNYDSIQEFMAEGLKGFFNEYFGYDKFPNTEELEIKTVGAVVSPEDIKAILFSLPKEIDDATKAYNAVYTKLQNTLQTQSDKVDAVVLRSITFIYGKLAQLLGVMQTKFHADMRRLLSAVDVEGAQGVRDAKRANKDNGKKEDDNKEGGNDDNAGK